MGLPLFVAKVESDLPSKASNKRDVLAPANAGVQSIRNRSRRIHDGDEDLALRQARWHQRALRESQRSLRRRGLTNALLPDSIQVVAAPSPPPQDYSDDFAANNHVYSSRHPVDMAMDEFLRLDDFTRQMYADRLQVLLGPRWTQEGLRARARILDLRNARANTNSQAETNLTSAQSRSRSAENLGIWTNEPRPQPRRARVVSPAAPGDEGISTEEISDLRRIIASMQSERRQAAAIRERRISRTRTARQQRGIDGLGDRQRSMSPEMWDTLLSTMTPDPEPPSVTSSFASFPTTQSHNTSATSFSVPESGPRVADGFVSEPPCDSGCENSDPEDDGPLQGRPANGGRRRPAGAAEGPFANRAEVHRSRRARAEPEHVASNGPGTLDNGGPPGLPNSHYLRLGWIGQLSVGASDEGGSQDQARQETEARAPPVHNEDDWSGMQLIVRRLARREDIPDEWWLEAGLSRTLGDDAEMR